ncbi:MAG: hypothetical protein E7481_04165 [Ruminococcaceae bacterium]|nr:hypothetical protein [Oscillospiraceae bacterium]
MRKFKFVPLAVGVVLLISMLTACGENVTENDEQYSPVTGNEDIVQGENENGGEEQVSLIDYSDPKWYDDALLVNVDPNWYGLNPKHISYESEEAVVESAKEICTQYAVQNISDVLFCIFEQTSILPSETQLWRASKYTWTEENGIPVDYAYLKTMYTAYEEYGIDVYQIMLDTLRENGIRPWITIRMNDCHSGADETSFLKSDFFYEAKEKGYMIGSNGEDYGYYNTCLNYAVPEVRQRMLDYIEEMLGRYDVFGLELDFMREIYSFDYINNPECRNQMNDFMREVNKILENAEQKWGHDIKLMVRTTRSIESSTVFGFDVASWVSEDLVDALVPSPRWACSDSGIPVKEWVDLVGDKDIAIFPCVEYLHLDYTLTTPDISKAYAAAWYSQGADGFYAYNHMDNSLLLSEVDGVCYFSREYCMNSERRFVVTYQDIYPEGTEGYEPLPVAIKTMNTKQEPLEINIGKVNADDTLIMTLGVGGNPEKIDISDVTINGLSATSIENKGLGLIKGPAEDGSGDVLLSDGYAYECVFTRIETDGNISIFVESEKFGVIDYIEIKIVPKK